MRSLFSTIAFMLAPALVTIANLPAHVALAIEPTSVTEPAYKTLLLRASPSTNGPQISVHAVDRSDINGDGFVEIAGLRLWVDKDDSLQFIRSQIADPAIFRRLVTVQLDAKLCETGLQPDRIPARGDEGREFGTEGMVLIEGGEDLTCTKRHGRGPFQDASAGVSFRCVRGAGDK